MNRQPFQVLFLCTGNSARSIMAETLANHLGAGRIQAYSAGSHPAGAVHPLAAATLERMHLPTEGLRSKAWDEFAQVDAPSLDFVFTVCDKAAGELCPVWPGQPVTAHWGVADPAAVEGGEFKRARAFKITFHELESRIRLFTQLPLEKLDRLGFQRRVEAIGRIDESSADETT